MFYKKNNTPKLDMELFKNPTSEYRGTPFWSWNCELDKNMLLRQIGYLKEMGFGGFHMHSRSGMATEYLSDEFMELVKACCDKAKDEGMLAYLYDEDRWSSGSAGGYVTKTKAFREKILTVSETPVDFVDKETGVREGLPYLIAVFDIVLDENSKLKSYKKIDANAEAKGIKKYAYITTAEESGWYNNQTYVDTLSNEAMQKFIDVTYESYKKSVGNYFGNVIPSIFTDEPQFAHKTNLSFASSNEDITFPWTTDFPETYQEAYGENVIETLPEIFWDLPDDKISTTRYHYHDHICERFVQAFADQCGAWCEKNNIALTGHMLQEENLHYQTNAIGEAMRSYRSFGIPGIDMLCNSVELTTAKQAQSTVHQYGREAMVSELYGVTNWDFDFKGHKFQGDWQAALGVTIRVPHLSWVSMKGSAKRDYPASINYQSPWYKEYGYIEDHFARINTALTRGKPIVNVGVIHPIESFWLHYGPADTGSDIRKMLDDNFLSITNNLLTGMVDFDFISESLLPSQCKEVTDVMKVGEMNYKTIIVPGCETIRRTTFDLLKQFKANGGKLIFVGDCPKYIDAQKTTEVEDLFNSSLHSSFDKLELLSLLENETDLKIVDDRGNTVNNYIHAMRLDGDVKWLFLARCEQDKDIDFVTPNNYYITINGQYIPTLFNTSNGETEELDYEIKNGKTVIKKVVYPNDSLLIQLKNGTASYHSTQQKKSLIGIIDFKNNVEFEREEDNVCVLDMAKYKLDNEEFNAEDEIIRIDNYYRRILNYPKADGCDAQPWILGKDIIEHYVTLLFEFESKTETEVFIAAEEAEYIKVNGIEIPLNPCGYYVDESIKKYKAGKLILGHNVIEVKMPIGKRTSLENCFLLGNFDIEVRGCQKTILPPSSKIGFGSLVNQGMPFYGGNLTYKTEITTPDCSLAVRVSRFRGAAVKVFMDGKDCGIIAYKPYVINLENVSAGNHTIEFEILGNRVNTFGTLHCCDTKSWYGPLKWYTYLPYTSDNCYNERDLIKCDLEKQNSVKEWYATGWSYEYVLKDTGILSSPMIEILSE